MTIVSGMIDYGMGQVNIDKSNDIRYGFISCHTPEGWIWDDFEGEYFHGCPECLGEFDEKNELIQNDDDDDDDEDQSWDFKCPFCGETGNEDHFISEEPIGQTWRGDEGYRISYSESMNCFAVEKSPYYTLSKLCSPCCPGAGDLDAPSDNGVKTYCLGLDFFEEGKCPYPVWEVDSDKQIFVSSQEEG